MVDDAPIPTPPEQRREDFRRRVVPVLVWGLAAVVCAALMFERGRNVEYIGLAQAHVYEVSAAADGTLREVSVDLYTRVRPGDVLARLDDRHLLAEIEVAEAAIRQLEAELGAMQAQMDGGSAASDYTADLRRFQIDEEDRRLETMSLKVELESEQIEEERLALEVRRAEQLLGEGLISEQEFDNARLAHRRVESRVAETRELLEETEAEYRAARARRIRYQSGLDAVASEQVQTLPLLQAIAVEDARLRQIQLQRESLTLRSPVHGQVSQILCRRGQAVVPGEPILTVTEPSVEEIVAYIATDDPRRPAANDAVLVANLRERGRVGESVVIGVSPDMQLLPEQLWRTPQVPSYGLAVRIAAIPSLNLTPGEPVRVRFVE